MELEAAKILVQYQRNLYSRLVWDEPENVVWTNMVMPTELFYACGLIPLHAEMTAGWISSLHLAEELIRGAEQRGIRGGLCSYHRAVIGALERGELPPPRLAVFSSHICDGGSGLLRYFQQRFHTKIFLLEVPYQQQSPEAVGAMAGQLCRLMEFLEKHTGRSIDPGALRRAAEYADQSRNWMQAANEMRKGRCLFWGNQALRNLFGISFLMGSPRGAEAAEAYFRQLKERSMRSGPWIRTEKPPRRILWFHFAPLQAGELMRYFEQTLGCVIAFDITSYIYWPTLKKDAPLVGLSKKILSHFFLWSSDERMVLYDRLLEEYQIDGVVIWMHQGCRAIPGASWELRRAAEKRRLPYLELPGDCIDPGGMSSEQVKLRMEAFRESMEFIR